MTVNNEVKVKINYQKLSVEFSGDPGKVLILINDFFSKKIPNIDLANKISINYLNRDTLISNHGSHYRHNTCRT